MTRTVLCALATLAVACGEKPQAPAPTSTAPAATGLRLGPNEVAITSGSEQIVGYLVKPRATGPFPALVAIHEWWGLNDQIRDTAEDLARDGYLTLALDLYRGKQTDNPEHAHELMRGLPEDRAMRDLVAAFNYLKSRPDVKTDRIGSIGWCMGGGFSIKMAVQIPELAACAVYYGSLPTEPDNLKAIHAPVVGFFGDEDEGIPESSVLAFEKSMRELGKTVEVHVYRAGHAFANPDNKNYKPAVADDARSKLTAFLAKNLKS